MNHPGRIYANTRVLFIGQNWHGSNATSFLRAFRYLGCDVQNVDDYHYFPRWETRHLKILRRLIYPAVVTDFNKQVRIQAQRFRPDLVFVFKGSMLKRATLLFLRSTGSLVFNFYPDANILNDRSHRSIVTNAPCFDCVFTPKSFHVADLIALGAPRVEFLPYAYDPWCHFPVDASQEDKQYFDSDVAFVGTWETDRARVLESLVANHFSFRLAIWGNRWERLDPDSPLRQFTKFQPANGMTQAKVFGNTQIALAFVKPPDLHTARTFEIPAFGVFMLAQRTSEHVLFFRENREIVCFSSVAELRDRIEYFNAHPTERADIAKAGYERVTQHGSYIDRAKSILDVYHGMAPARRR